MGENISGSENIITLHDFKLGYQESLMGLIRIKNVKLKYDVLFKIRVTVNLIKILWKPWQ